ncbi:MULTISPECIES: HlyD family type I secretion periplasmic adaptor subunit [Pseudomonas syringae group]|uniref:HlyD family type I secretion periplasmic adaptor subunit n=1 Tax=Pseudomonas syringae group TaxID=136849 RepID=UPI000BB627BA|nr:MULTISPECIES: HlyD family type I secretion periplasmic adaptor subunit [Pseudomonas syringae group]MBS7415996.1 HlyD family type I secretion periplasmic adaptor subunit [Pseudomonas syringae]PBP54186.1 hemolysin secretion protein D [Pseudomonas syringae]PBP79821.1 hemolysin secretion protein D [Pseudomonas syringae]
MSNAESTGLLQRYRRVWRQSWRHRREMDAPKRLAHEVQFLPAALELQDKPSHPAPRVFMWAIMFFAALALLWACLGKIDVVATASGKIIPSGKTKTIQSSETAVVKAIHVRDGQSVKAGQLLLELDSTSADADVGRVRSDLLAARIDSARAAAMLDAINQRKPPRDLTGTILDADPIHVLAAGRWLQGQYQEYRSSLDLVDAEIQQRQADIQAARIQVMSLQKTLPIAAKLASDYENLLKKQYIARHAYLEKEQARLDLERQLSVQQASVLQSTAARQEAERRREGVVAQTRRAMLDLLQQADQKISSFNQDLTKARYQEDLTTLEAPVDGTVQQLAVHTVGGVVTPAQPLMVLVPDGQPVEVEAMLENKDVGFVRAGQAVTVKVETFTFTKYGTIEGEVISVSSDAIEDEKRGLIYSSKIRLNSDTLNVNGVDIKLSPGMAVTAEVKTNKRRVIEYFLSPLQQHVSESLRER